MLLFSLIKYDGAPDVACNGSFLCSPSLSQRLNLVSEVRLVIPSSSVSHVSRHLLAFCGATSSS